MYSRRVTGFIRAAASFLILASGCADKQTWLVIEVRSELIVPDRVDQLRFEITGMETGSLFAATLRLSRSWPYALRLRPSSRDDEAVQISVTGLRRNAADGSSTVVVRAVTVDRFVSGDVRVVAIELDASCEGVSCYPGVPDAGVGNDAVDSPTDGFDGFDGSDVMDGRIDGPDTGPVFPTGPNYRSIGARSGPVYSTGNASVEAGSSAVSFGGGATLPSDVGTGDLLTLGGEALYIQARDSAASVTLQRGATRAHVDAPFSIHRAFNSLQGWETAREGDLVADNRMEVGVVYNDGVLTTGAHILGSTTDETHFMWLTVAPGHRHRGIAGTGARVRLPNGERILDVDDDYTRIHWLELDCSTDRVKPHTS